MKYFTSHDDGGYVWAEYAMPWKHPDEVLTCFRCIVRTPWPINVITLTVTI